MIRNRLHLPSPALIVSTVALFAALGGGAYAATSLSHSALTWHTPVALNHWQLYGGGYATLGYAKDSNGVVHLRGGVKNGTSNTVFRLPVGYRPSHYLYMPIYTVSGGVGSIYIYPTGTVNVEGSGSTGYAGLDGVSFGAGE